MTPTTSEREARELLAREYERSDLKIAAAILRDKRENEATRAAIRAIIAALTQQEAQQECPKCGGTGGERWHEADGSENGARCDACDGFGTQQEAQGAVAPYGWVHEPSSHVYWRADNPLVAEGKCRAVYTTPPAPMDVRALEGVAESLCELEVCARNASRATGIGGIDGDDLTKLRAAFGRLADSLEVQQNTIRALLAGQPAGVECEHKWHPDPDLPEERDWVYCPKCGCSRQCKAALGGGGGGE